MIHSVAFLSFGRAFNEGGRRMIEFENKHESS